jgi:hypothetical protein
MDLCSSNDAAGRLDGTWLSGGRRSPRSSWEWKHRAERCPVVVGGIIPETQHILRIDRSGVGVVSNAIAHSPARDDLRPSSGERGDGNNDQEVQSLHGGVLECRGRLSVVGCKEGVRMRVWDVGERC